MNRNNICSVTSWAFLAVLLFGGTHPLWAQSAPGSSAVTADQVDALLGAYEGVAPGVWRSLGDAAIPILESIASDQSALPMRRAHALNGLAALGSGSRTMQRVANSDAEPLGVRISAVNGLAEILPQSDLIPALRPLLNDPQYKIRGIAAQVLANTPAGCAEIAGMARQEAPAWRARFARTCRGQSHSADEPREDEGKTVVDYFGISEVANVFSPSGNQVPAGLPFGPDCGGCGVFFGLFGGFSTLLPYSPTLPFASGPWTFSFGSSFPGDTVDIQALIKTAPAPLTSGKLDANLFFVGVPGLTARSARTDPNFQAMLSKVRTIYAQIGLELGDLTYIDITGADQISFEIIGIQTLGSTDVSRLFMLSSHPEARDGAINIFFVDFLAEAGESGFSPGVPGSPVRGTPGSGVAISTGSFFPFDLNGLAVTVAHETGHWLGLYHTSFGPGRSYDPLPDTPECAAGTPLPQCPDATNLMFPLLTGAFPPIVTPNQQLVMLRNPVVSQPPQTGARVSSIGLGSFTGSGGGPIKVNVPPGAVSMELVGVATFKPTTIRVPQDYPTIQLAVNSAHPLDTIRVGPGRWCGADITQPLNLTGQDGATIMGCPAGTPGPVGTRRKRGFRIEAAATGTSISGFVFDGKGVTLGGDPLYVGIEAMPGAHNLVIDSNTFLGTAYAVSLTDGINCQVTHNVFNGFTVLSDGEGGVAILMVGDTGQFKGNSILHNQINSTVPPGDLSGLSWVNEADVPLAGIVVDGPGWDHSFEQRDFNHREFAWGWRSRYYRDRFYR